MPFDAADGGRANSPQPRLNFQLRFLPVPGEKKRRRRKDYDVRTRIARVRGNSARKRAAKRLRRDVSRNASRVISLTSLKDNRGYSSSVIRLPKRPVSPSQRPFTRALVISGSREKMVGCRQPPPKVHDKRNIPGIFSFFHVADPFGKWKRAAVAANIAWNQNDGRSDRDRNEKYTVIYFAKEFSEMSLLERLILRSYHKSR